MPKDLRSFIDELESKYPEEVARVTKSISPRYELTALLTQLEKAKSFPLFFCENVHGSDAPVVINAQASHKTVLRFPFFSWFCLYSIISPSNRVHIY